VCIIGGIEEMSISVGLIAQTIERIAPKSWAEDWDNVGLLVGNPSTPVERILLTLDGTLEVLQEARERGAQLIVAHHPILFRPLKNLRSDNQAAQIPIQLIQAGIAYYAAHTNLDQSSYSSSWTLGRALGLQRMDYLSVTNLEKLVKFVTCVPQTHAELVRQALVKVGVGEGVTSGPNGDKYSECFFRTEGIGMFRPLQGSNPTIGETGALACVEETRLESLIPVQGIDRAVKALKRAHPYEEPAFHLIPLLNDGPPRGYGVVGYLNQATELGVIREKVLVALKELVPSTINQEPGVRMTGKPNRQIRKIVIVNGSGGSFIPKAVFKGADLLITGDVDHHGALDALEAGMAVLDIGHFWSEVPMINTLSSYLKNEKGLSDVEFLVSENMQSPWNF
jgi:dinuclear metal center YbgI/SA1388 family protein